VTTQTLIGLIGSGFFGTVDVVCGSDLGGLPFSPPKGSHPIRTDNKAKNAITINPIKIAGPFFIITSSDYCMFLTCDYPHSHIEQKHLEVTACVPILSRFGLGPHVPFPTGQ
jgi:hypothetical protein